MSVAPIDEVPARALVVTAHPDDVDFGAAGTVASWVAQGTRVTYCIVTDGDAGGFDPAVPRSEIPRIRRAEQVAAARILGVEDVRFLGYRDGELEVTQGLRRDISRIIREVRPERMLIQSPDRNWNRLQSSHPDHLAAGEAAIAAAIMKPAAMPARPTRTDPTFFIRFLSLHSQYFADQRTGFALDYRIAHQFAVGDPSRDP